MSAAAAAAATAKTNGNKKNEEEEDDFGSNVHISSHPVVSHKITKLRSSETRSGIFRAAMREVTYHLAYEATRDLTTKPIQVSVSVPKQKKGKDKGTPDHIQCEGRKLNEKIALIPILRSGLGMADSLMELLPNATSYHIGMYKIPLQDPVMYFNKLPRKCQCDIAYVLDPVIATASTTISVVKILRKWGVPKIHVISIIGSKSGMRQLLHAHPNVSVTVGTVDDEVNDAGVVLPGLGDAGDRLFGTFEIYEDDEEEDETLLHPSKRKRTMSQG